MSAPFPYYRVNWLASLFLTLTFVTAVVGAPLYVLKFGLDPLQVWLFLFYFAATGLSITVGYHRLFAHRSFTASWPVKLWTLVFGACAFEDSALDWVSDHRNHHKHVDGDEDPYSISRGFLWAHIGWIFFKLYPRELDNVQDLQRDRLVMWQHRWHRWIAGLVGLALPALVAGLVAGWPGALGGFLIAGVARVVCVHHCTFFINSLCHTLGSRPYDGETSARDSWFMALLTFGEGYHNYHHAFQHDYRNGVKRWQFDPSKWCIWLLEKAGLAHGLRRVSPEKIALAELREAKRQAGAAATMTTSGPCCARWHAAVGRLSELTTEISEAYAELEQAVTARVSISRQRLAEIRNQAAELVRHLAEIDQLRAAYAL
jgi:stearoyl-CoA desaturase (delta-9 desaturase)